MPWACLQLQSRYMCMRVTCFCIPQWIHRHDCWSYYFFPYMDVRLCKEAEKVGRGMKEGRKSVRKHTFRRRRRLTREGCRWKSIQWRVEDGLNEVLFRRLNDLTYTFMPIRACLALRFIGFFFIHLKIAVQLWRAHPNDVTPMRVLLHLEMVVHVVLGNKSSVFFVKLVGFIRAKKMQAMSCLADH